MTILVGTGTMLAQETRFFIPKEIKEAYKANTRSMNGAPGDDYWHNTVDYDIDVAFDPATRGLDGSETVTYHNNSPDDLGTLVIRLYYDVFREGNSRRMAVTPEDINDGVNISRLVVNGQEYDLNNQQLVNRTATNLLVRLPEPLASGESIDLEIDWESKVSLTNRRTGTYDSTSFFVAYWYPQISVYDDVFGWDVMDYHFASEFYNNLANFDVRISAPEDFTIWATGLLQNAEEVLPDTQYERYQNALAADEETVNIIRAEDLNSGYANKDTTWHFTADEVSDFAFATSDHYLWDAATQEVEGRDVLIESVFPIDQAGNFPDLTQTQRKIMRHFSEDIPGVPYPYEAFTTFIGLFGGGMEFPMMANNAGPGLGVTIHEMFHTYFPMYVRVNERRFAHMDEGWAAYIDNLTEQRFFEDDPGFIIDMYKGGVQGTMGSYSDLPLITSTEYMANNYGYASYSLPAFFYSILHHYLGDERFLEAYQAYITRWAKKSPTPYDFIYTFEDVTGEDLSWLWNPWFFEYGYADVRIKGVDDGVVTVMNSGNRPVPLVFEMEYEDGTDATVEAKADVWKESDSYSLEIPRSDELATLSVNGSIVDFTTLNNFYPPLSERYKDYDLPEGIAGTYSVSGFNIKCEIQEEDGLYKMLIPAAGYEAYLMPDSNTTFVSIDGSSEAAFDIADDGTVSGMTVQAFGYTLPATKDK
jgi:hypothetical protein